ncbi:hypothetical protein HDU87_008678 [Geranomyces variabilis]|uniref:Uncharacterized protein n=1 Tax=Geranomyces variabilis TaxID=109894 RepID=A0AAD5TEA2_9FUNG|nr:hypothetical protein HDU87_008678 [Geranomyces variabilis]
MAISTPLDTFKASTLQAIWAKPRKVDGKKDQIVTSSPLRQPAEMSTIKPVVPSKHLKTEDVLKWSWELFTADTDEDDDGDDDNDDDNDDEYTALYTLEATTAAPPAMVAVPATEVAVAATAAAAFAIEIRKPTSNKAGEDASYLDELVDLSSSRSSTDSGYDRAEGL